MLIERLTVRARYDESKDVIGRREIAKKMLSKEAGQDEPNYGHNISKCISLADWRVNNSGPLERLFDEAVRFTEKYILNGFSSNR